MATSINDQAGRQKVLEGLWLIGIDPSQLNVDPGLDPNTFLNQLHNNGVNDDFVRRAISGVDWRTPTDNEPLSQKVAELLRASGYRDDEVQTFLNNAQLNSNDPTKDDPQALLRILTSQFNDRTAGAMIYKATGGQDVQGAAWNPFRTDQPPPGANVNYGSAGKMATQYLQPGTVGRESTPVGEYGGLPIPPSPRQQAAQAAPAAVAKPAPAPAMPATPAPGTNRNDTVDNPANWDDDKIKTFIKQNFGANAYFIDIPEVWNALKNVVKNGQGVNGLEPALESTQFWKQTNAAGRNWYVQERADPAQAAADIAQSTSMIIQSANNMGIQLDPTRAQEIAQSYQRYGWSQSQLTQALAAEWHYDPSSKQQASIVSTMKSDAQNWLVPLSDQAIQSWGASIMSGNATQEQFDQYLRSNAKSLFPQLSQLIDDHAGDKNFTLDTYIDPYRQQAANTLGISTDDINFMDPKWRQALDQIDPKTGQRRVMTLSEWDSTVKSDPTFDYDHTQNGVNDAMSLATSLKSSLGF